MEKNELSKYGIETTNITPTNNEDKPVWLFADSTHLPITAVYLGPGEAPTSAGKKVPVHIFDKDNIVCLLSKWNKSTTYTGQLEEGCKVRIFTLDEKTINVEVQK